MAKAGALGWIAGMALGCTCAVALAGDTAPDAEAGPLHVPSPDWRDQVVYFAMIDRFADGEPANNDQGVDEYDPADPRKYSGGDLRGLAHQLDYIQGLGATALWITPHFANQWWNPGGTYGGYHGYWASDFKAVDAHYGTLADLRALSRGLHGRGMFLVQDVVVNHVADYLQCEAGDAPAAERCTVRADARGRTAPVGVPFQLNDARNEAHAAAGVYHWTPSIGDFTDRTQELDFALAGLDDLDTENAVVRRALRDAYGYWIREAGVDAFRVDTAYHVPAGFFQDFLHAADVEAPGVTQVAAETGRNGFLAFGEGFGADRAYEDEHARKLDAYMQVDGGLPSMIDFPLYGTMGDVFARGRPSAELAHRIENRMQLHDDPWRMPTFIDNHDVDRFLAGGSEAGLKQALLALMTLPGIPVIYYGTEQGFTERRASMFAGGHGSGGEDHFDTTAPMYRYLQRAIALRRDNKVFSRGTPTVLATNAAAPGAIAWRMDPVEQYDDEGASALVVFNTADHVALLDNLDTGLAPGVVLEPLFAIEGEQGRLVTGEDSHITLVLPPRSGAVWLTSDAIPSPDPAPSFPRRRESISISTRTSTSNQIHMTGTAQGNHTIQLVIDGKLEAAPSIPVADDGTWTATIRTDSMTDPTVTHRAVAYDPTTNTTSAPVEFKVDLDWQPAADHDDPTGDDTGPTGTYTYPTDPGYATHPADIERVRAWTAGGALRIELTMRSISTAWNPPNGFDHVAFTIFLQLPERSAGVNVMPLQNGTLPDAMHWQYRLRVHGWSNALFSFAGAGASDEGMPTSPGAAIDVDHDARTVTFTIPANAIGHPGSLEGARLHITTWDQDAEYRRLSVVAGDMQFGGGQPDAPLVMDQATAVLSPSHRQGLVFTHLRGKSP
ncbi:MAG TPA: alpha-amylase family glycosyl hydrolase [Xanthomonadaceae bacterium]|nr:alpha-amylase family glycosyl hydrolase [Xanthomonadaceae bacterium]